MTARRLLIVQHVPHERLGTFEPALASGGMIRYLNAADERAEWPSLDEVDGLVVMGGPQSVSEQARDPFLKRELALLREALTRGRPILGVCLGAQLLSAALGGRVTKSPQKEIGWYPLMREPGADGDALCAPFGQTETVFQWHGDTYSLPQGAVRLASSPQCREQAFRYGDRVYGVQFHLEMTAAMIRAWMRIPLNRAELEGLRGVVDPRAILYKSPQHLPRLRTLAHHVATAFCRLLEEPIHAAP